MNKNKGVKTTPNSKMGNPKTNLSQKKNQNKPATAFIMPELQIQAKLMELRLPIS
jgi:hypothetical protein